MRISAQRQLDEEKEKYQAELHRLEEEKRQEAERLKEAEAERVRKIREEMRISAKREIDEEKEKHQMELNRIKGEKEQEAERLKEAEAEKFRKLQEEMKISAQRQVAEEKAKQEHFQAELERVKRAKDQEKERQKDAEEEKIRKLEEETKRSAQKIQELTAEKDEMERVREIERQRMSKVEEEKKQLEEETRKLKEAQGESGRTQSVQLELTSTHETGLWSMWSLTVMPETGQVVMCGKRRKGDDPSLFIYTLEPGRTWREKVVKTPCGHGVFLLDVHVQEQELLAVSCDMCQDIKLLRLDTQQVVATAFSGEKVWRMCHGDTNRLYVELYFSGQVIELDCSGYSFTKIKTVNTGISDRYYGLCYMSPQRLLAVSSGSKINVVSCEENSIASSVEGKVDGLEMYPRGLCFSHQLNALLVGDHQNSRILVLDPDIGTHRQTINLPDMCGIADLLLYKNQIIMVHKTQYKWKFSHFTVK